MEENTATMQTLVIAHAAFGHNHFFRNNYLFKQWTDADGILDYLAFAKGYVSRARSVTARPRWSALDAAHALMTHGVHRHPQRKKLDLRQEELRERERREHRGASSTTCGAPCRRARQEPFDLTLERRQSLLQLPQENILYFLEKSAPRLRPWQREAPAHRAPGCAVFLSAGPDQGMNEGTATYVHYRIMTRLREEVASPKATSSNSCSLIPTWCSSRPTTIRASPASTLTRSASP